MINHFGTDHKCDGQTDRRNVQCHTVKLYELSKYRQWQLEVENAFDQSYSYAYNKEGTLVAKHSSSSQVNLQHKSQQVLQQISTSEHCFSSVASSL